MADAVADVFADGGTLLAEAGTGTGKTLAYLVPAILSRQRVLVSTGTKNLQEQIFFKDLPVLRDSLGVPFTADLHEGARQLSLPASLRRAARSGSVRRSGSRAPTAVVPVQAIDEWSRETETGDRAEMDDLPEDLPFWPDIAATSENCIGTDCPRYQRLLRHEMRQRAAESDVVIVNHHLLCADAVGAAERVRRSDSRPAATRSSTRRTSSRTSRRSTSALSVSNYRFDDFARDVDRAVVAEQLARPRRAGQLRDDAAADRDAARAFFRHAADAALRAAGRRQRGDNRVRVRAGAHGAGWWTRPRALTAALDALEADDRAGAGSSRRTCSRSAGAPPSMRDDVKFLLRADDPGLRLLPRDPRPRRVPARLADRRLDDRPRDAVRPHDGDGAHLGDADRRRLVRLRPRPARHLTRPHEVRLRRSSTTRAQAILYLPQQDAGPAVAGVRRGGGRRGDRDPEAHATAAPSCSSRATRTCARSTASRRAELDYPILVQGTAPRSALLREFKATPQRRAASPRPASGRASTSSARR